MKKIFMVSLIIFAMMFILASCNKVIFETPPHEHAWGEWYVTKEATCTEDGEREKCCDTCYESVTETIPAPGTHDSENNLCRICGEYVYSQGLAYNGYGEITGIGTCTDSVVVIPSVIVDEYGDIEIVKIGEGAFKDCDFIQQVVLGDNVAAIGNSAFSGCDSLVSVYVPNSVAVIESGAFSGCYRLAEVINSSWLNIKEGSEDHGGIAKYAFDVRGVNKNDVNAKKSRIVNQNGFLFYPKSNDDYPYNKNNNCLLGYCGEETGVVLPKSFVGQQGYGETYIINDYAFYENDFIKSVVIPNSVTEIGTAAFRGCNSLKSVKIGEGVKRIHEDAFAYSGITNVVIPNSVTEIGRDAFSGCNSLKSVKIGEGVKSISESAFAFSGITSITIPENVEAIDYHAFYGCDGLVEVINKSSLGIKVGSTDHGYIGYYAKEVHNGESKLVNQDGFIFYHFEGNNYLMSYSGEETELVLPDTYNGQSYEIYNSAFWGCNSIVSVKIVGGVTGIGENAFYGCSSLQSVEIGDSVTSIGDWAFYECTSLTSVEIGDSVTSIGNWAFYECTSLTSVEIGDSVTSIGYGAFYDCSSLTSIEIGDSVTIIDDVAFGGCSSLMSITLPANLVEIVDGAFWNCINLMEVVNNSSLAIEVGSSSYGGVAEYAIDVHSGESRFVNQDDCLFYSADNFVYLIKYTGDATQIVLPDTYNGLNYGIYDKAFMNCDKIVSITLGKGVTSIGEFAFYGCSSLQSVEIGDSVISIGGAAFYECSSLQTVKIGDSVTSIGGSVFSYCSSLASIVIPGSVTSIGYGAFYRCESLTDVYYGGTRDDWNRTLEDDSEESYDFTVHYNYYG